MGTLYYNIHTYYYHKDCLGSSAWITDEKGTEVQYFDYLPNNEPALLGYLSVDPLSDKYPSFSPYVYCANNSIKLIDLDDRKKLTPILS